MGEPRRDGAQVARSLVYGANTGLATRATGRDDCGVSNEELEPLDETQGILSDPSALERIRAAQAEVQRGDVLTEQQVRSLLAPRPEGEAVD